MIIAGIDPGLTGALAFYDTETGDVETIDMPTLEIPRSGKTRREADPHVISDIFWKRHCGHAFLEQSWPRPIDGAMAGFKTGDGYGMLRGILAAVGVPHTPVSPQKWKHWIGVTGDKDASRARASQLLPKASGQWPLKKHDGRAEAALIALYGVGTIAGLSRPEPLQLAASPIARVLP